MSDEKAGWLLEDKDTYDACPPPPYVSNSGSDDDTRRQHDGATAQRQGDCMSKKGSSSTWWRRALRRVLVPSHKASQRQARGSDIEPAAAPIPPKRDRNVIADDPELPRWYKHNGMTCGHGATSTKLPLPVAPPLVAARWQQAWLSLSSDHLPELLRGPPIPWRANIDDCCHANEVRFVIYPYPIPFFTGQPESGTAILKACYHNNTASMPCGISTSVGGHTYERSIKLCLLRDRPDSDSIKNSVMFYTKALWRPWVEATDLEPHGHGKPWYAPSPLGVAHDEEVRQLVDDIFEKLIRGGDE
ncbi:hypothetical protein B0T25DRAFT_535405 [Lasiosphaeria hispida]|uniref:Uncharacterized protein n=1 Tax=Lasiosphaeria hispida TaxID=260671 RepID=A0AAJ0MIM1_9PEZI|nr:hypothetical protein B0T25DRAFT_535405 [Lasiosphaeria hispida]